MTLVILKLCFKCPFFYECNQVENPKCKGSVRHFRKLMKNWKGLDEKGEK